MDFLGIGIQEIFFILIIALIIFGPKDIVKAGQTAGRFLRKLVTSPGWRSVQETSRDLRNIPNKLMREAGLEEIQEDMNEIRKIATPPDFKAEIKSEFQKVEDGLSAWTKPAVPKPPDEAGKTTDGLSTSAGETTAQVESNENTDE